MQGSTPIHIFIVEDDPDYAAMLRHYLARKSHCNVRVFATGEEAVDHLEKKPDLVFLDLILPGEGGIQILKQLRVARPSLPVVVVSAQDDVSVALEAIRLGAHDYITKGYDDFVKLQAIAEHIADQKVVSAQVESLRRQLPASEGLEHIVGESSAMAKVFQLMRKALPGDLVVTIIGESGTGKELIARAIHSNSKRTHGPFVVVNCAAIPRDLLESEFFGHEKGAFTGAHSRKIGKFEQANRGTLFLDEISEMSLGLQAKILRALQNREITRVGGNETISIETRILTATNQDIGEMVKKGGFREDLYYRLFQFPIYIPPLRQRDEDALRLADFFIQGFSQNHDDVPERTLSTAARQFIKEHPWPGNVRQLKNVIERAMLICETEKIEIEDLLMDVFQRPAVVQAPGSKLDYDIRAVENTLSISHAPSRNVAPYEEILATDSPDDIVSLEALKKTAVQHAYRLCGGNIEKTASRLGVARSTVYRLLEKTAK